MTKLFAMQLLVILILALVACGENGDAQYIPSAQDDTSATDSSTELNLYPELPYEATNLERLVLRDNLISDITPLAGLTNLTWLDMQSNQISDITPLAGLIIIHDTSPTNAFIFLFHHSKGVRFPYPFY